MDVVLQKLEVIEKKVDALFDILGEIAIDYIEEEELTEEERGLLKEALKEAEEGKVIPLEDVLDELEHSSKH